jgi:hypothetical protein
VARAARRVLRCLIDWDVLGETAEKGVYDAPRPRPVRDKLVAAWLLEAALRSSGATSGLLRALTQAPALFPFELVTLHLAELERNARLEWFRQGLDQDMVTLRGDRPERASAPA